MNLEKYLKENNGKINKSKNIREVIYVLQEFIKTQ